jgi:hypothetical protein
MIDAYKAPFDAEDAAKIDYLARAKGNARQGQAESSLSDRSLCSSRRQHPAAKEPIPRRGVIGSIRMYKTE